MKPGQFIFRSVPLLIMLAVSVMLFAALLKGPVRTPSPMIGKTIAAFNIPELNSPARMSPESWKGKVALINIFATWCEPCQVEHEMLLALSQTGKLPIYGIAWKDTAKRVTKWLNTRGNPYKAVGFDDKGRVTIPFSMRGVPETFLLDKNGVIRFHYNSMLTEDIVHDEILPLVEQLNKADAAQ